MSFLIGTARENFAVSSVFIKENGSFFLLPATLRLWEGGILRLKSAFSERLRYKGAFCKIQKNRFLGGLFLGFYPF